MWYLAIWGILGFCGIMAFMYGQGDDDPNTLVMLLSLVLSGPLVWAISALFLFAKFFKWLGNLSVSYD